MCSHFGLSSKSVASSMGSTLQESRSSMGSQVSQLELPERAGPSQPAHAARTSLLYQRLERPHPPVAYMGTSSVTQSRKSVS